MSKTRVNYKSDLPPLEVKFKINGNVVDVPDHDFIIRFFVDGAPGASYECSFVDGEYTNCVKSSDTILTCFIDNHKFSCGRLCCEYIDLCVDRRYEDKVLKTVTPSCLDVILVEGAGDDNVEVLAATFDFEPNEIVSIVTEESDLDGGTNTITIKQGNGEELTFHVKNGHKGSKGDTGVYVTEPDFSIVDDLETDSSTDALSAGMGKSLNGRLSLIEDATSGDIDYEPLVVSGKYIVRDPSSDKGDISDVGNGFLHIYTGLTAGSVIKIKYTGTNSTSTAQAAGWYTTDDVSQMSKSNFTEVDGLHNYLKNVMNQTFTVTVPTGGPTLVLSAAIDADTSVVCEGAGGAKIIELEAAVDLHEERIDDLEAVVADYEDAIYVEESEPKSVDDSLDGYRIVNSTTNLSDDYPQFFDLKSYKVAAGDKVRIVNTSNSEGSSTRVYAFYSDESLVDEYESVLPSASTYVDIDSSYEHTWASAVFDDTLTVPTGANLLVVTQNKRTQSNPVVYDINKVGVGEAVEEFVDLIHGFSPYKMQVTRNGENFCVAYNRGDGVEMVYLFSRIFTTSNNVLGLRAVGCRNVNRANPVATWDSNEITVLCNQASSDMFCGAVGIEVGSDVVWIGGSHKQNNTETSVNIGWGIEVNGKSLSDGETVNCSRATVTAVNTISHPSWGDVLEEIVIMEVYGDYLDVTVKHNYKYSGGVGKTIKRYYGMQSNGFGSRNTNLVSTVAGKYPGWIVQNAFVWNDFTKGSYPNFCEFVERKTDGWHLLMRLDTTSYEAIDGYTYIADHKWLGSSDIIAAENNTNKLYHVQIYGTGKEITSGMKYMWKGTYKWWR